MRNHTLFNGLPAKVRVARYHSLAADEESLPKCLRVISRADDGEVMAVQHAEFLPHGGSIPNRFSPRWPGDDPKTSWPPNSSHGVFAERGDDREAIFKLVNKQDLTYDEAYDVINKIMSGETTRVQTAFLSALSTKSTKSETIAEIAGCAAAMRSHATKVDYDKPLLEIVGTGGDKTGSFNISTTAALVIAAGGAKVAKHGNRAASSKSGTADCKRRWV